MTLILTYLPYLISFLIGYLFILLLDDPKKRLPLSIHLFLASGIGLGISSQITFFSFAFWGELNRAFVIALNVISMTGLLVGAIVKTRGRPGQLINLSHMSLANAWPYAVLILCSYPLWNHGHFYVFGGWDAWATWNLKSKMMFLSPDGWSTIFDPILWRSSPHYPLQLPMTNLWGWIFMETPEHIIPVTNAFVFSFSTVGLLLAGLIHVTRSRFSVLCATLLLFSSMFVKLSLSQYADIVVAYYLLAALICVLMTKMSGQRVFAVLAGVSLGFLSFSKGEGFIAAGIIFCLTPLYLLWKHQPTKKTFVYIYGAGAVASIVTILFSALFSPESETFINGLMSDTHPVSFYRVKAILSFILVEMISPTWNGLWIVLVAGLILSSGRCFSSKSIIFPGFLLGYIGVISVYYFVNTYFDDSRILWWLQVSLHRLMYATLPSVVFWTFHSLWQLPTPSQEKTPNHDD